MYTGMMIEQLVEMVARAESHASQADLDQAHDDALFASPFLFEMAESQPMMIGVA